MIYSIAELLTQMACVKSCCTSLQTGKLCYNVIIQHKFLMILPLSSHLVPLLLWGEKIEKEEMDSQVLLFKEEQDISWNLITIFALSYQHVSAPGLLQGHGHKALFLGAVTSPCVLWLICVWDVLLGSWACSMPSLTRFASHGASYTGRSLAFTGKGFCSPLFSLFSIRLCCVCAGARLPPPPSPCPRIFFPIQSLPAIFLFVRSQQSSSSSSSSRLGARP